jgi:hypothetical protein
MVAAPLHPPCNSQQPTSTWGMKWWNECTTHKAHECKQHSRPARQRLTHGRCGVTEKSARNSSRQKAIQFETTMKNRYPPVGEIEKTIADIERRLALRRQLQDLSTALCSEQRRLRQKLCEELYVADENNKPTDDYIAAYRRYVIVDPRNADSDIEALTVTCAELLRDYNRIAEQLNDGATEARAAALSICAHAEGMKRAEHDAVIQEIATKLAPYCSGDQETARSLASETPAAAALRQQRQRCYFSIGETDDLMTPLRAALEFATMHNKETK